MKRARFVISAGALASIRMVAGGNGALRHPGRTRTSSRPWCACTARARAPGTPASSPPGRAYSSAYVEFVHYAERLYEAAETMAPEHAQKSAAPAHTH
jgi:hypothetical protein